MAKTVTVSLNKGGITEQVEAQEQAFQTIREDWNEYETASGVKIRLTPVVVKIFRAIDAEGRPAFTTEGDPNVIVRNSLQVVASGGPGKETATKDVH